MFALIGLIVLALLAWKYRAKLLAFFQGYEGELVQEFEDQGESIAKAGLSQSTTATGSPNSQAPPKN